MTNYENPLLGPGPLPAFDLIRPEHVETGIRALLDDNRARIRQIEAGANPSFRSLVEPLEELQHRLSRAWSPVGHLNGVMNNEALRERYNACLPLLSEYGTDLSQNEELFRAFTAVRQKEAASLDNEQLAVVDHALHEFHLAGVALDGPPQGALQGRDARSCRAWRQSSKRTSMDATNSFSHHVTAAEELAGLNAMLVSQGAGTRHDRRQGRLAAGPRSAHICGGSHRCPLAGAAAGVLTAPGAHAPPPPARTRQSSTTAR